MAGTAKNHGWKKLGEKDMRINRFRTIRKMRYRLPTGIIGNFYLNKGREITAALVLTKQKKVVLVEQFRLGPNRILWELPGGGVEEGETPRQAMTREILEETGYRGTLRQTGRSTNNVYSTSMRTHFVMTDAVRVADPSYDKYEHGRVRLVSLAQFRRLLRTGMMSDVETGYLGLDALRLL